MVGFMRVLILFISFTSSPYLRRNEHGKVVLDVLCRDTFFLSVLEDFAKLYITEAVNQGQEKSLLRTLCHIAVASVFVEAISVVSFERPQNNFIHDVLSR